MKTAHDIILKPVITENSMAGIADKKYTFKVATDAKMCIRDSVIALGTSDISAAQTAGAHCLDALCGNGCAIAGAHGIAHALLHGTAEGHAVLQLTSDILSNQLSVGSSALDLDDVDDNSCLLYTSRCV